MIKTSGSMYEGVLGEERNDKSESYFSQMARLGSVRKAETWLNHDSKRSSEDCRGEEWAAEAGEKDDSTEKPK